MKDRLLQLLIAAVLSMAGIALLFVGACFAPQGEIHESVLIAFGEVATFAGSIIGIDYHYKSKYHETDPTPPHDNQRQSGQGTDVRTIRPGTHPRQ